MALNKGSKNSDNPTDADQANPGNTANVPVDHVIKADQETDSVFLVVPQPVEVDGVTYSGTVKVAKENVAKVKAAGEGVVELKEDEVEHVGAKPMPKELDGPDYV